MEIPTSTPITDYDNSNECSDCSDYSNYDKCSKSLWNLRVSIAAAMKLFMAEMACISLVKFHWCHLCIAGGGSLVSATTIGIVCLARVLFTTTMHRWFAAGVCCFWIYFGIITTTASFKNRFFVMGSIELASTDRGPHHERNCCQNKMAIEPSEEGVLSRLWVKYHAHISGRTSYYIIQLNCTFPLFFKIFLLNNQAAAPFIAECLRTTLCMIVIQCKLQMYALQQDLDGSITCKLTTERAWIWIANWWQFQGHTTMRQRLLSWAWECLGPWKKYHPTMQQITAPLPAMTCSYTFSSSKSIISSAFVDSHPTTTIVSVLQSRLVIRQVDIDQMSLLPLL